MGCVILVRFVQSERWSIGKWFSTHEEAQFWVHTLPLDKIVWRIIQLKEDWIKEPAVEIKLEEDTDIPAEVIKPQCNLDDEECESCQ